MVLNIGIVRSDEIDQNLNLFNEQMIPVIHFCLQCPAHITPCLIDMVLLSNFVRARGIRVTMAALELFVAIFCLFFVPSAAPLSKCRETDYVKLMFPCDEKTVTRSLVYYLNATW